MSQPNSEVNSQSQLEPVDFPDVFEAPADRSGKQFELGLRDLEDARSFRERHADEVLSDALTRDGRILGTPKDVEPEDLSSAGWALVLPEGEAIDAKEAKHWKEARRLLAHRRSLGGNKIMELRYPPARAPMSFWAPTIWMWPQWRSTSCHITCY